VVRIAFVSAGELLRRMVAFELDISAHELHVLPPVVVPCHGDSSRKQFRLVLTDDHPNGAGYVTELVRRWHELVGDFCSDSPRGAFAARLVSDEHTARCERACYDCLRSYRNRFIDSLLDWRLGYELIRTLWDEQYVAGADGKFRSPGLASWLSAVQLGCNTMATAFENEFTVDDALPADRLPTLLLRHHDRCRLVAVRHPFWADRSSLVGNIVDCSWVDLEARSEDMTHAPTLIDSFNLIHRPSRTRQRLIEALRSEDFVK
jgi:hypothetical protein